MPLGQFTQGQTLVEAQTVFDSFPVVLNRGLKADQTNLYGKPTVTLNATATGAGTGATVTNQIGSDFAGRFTLTGGTAPAAGSIATVAFATPLGAAPSCVILNLADNILAANVAPLACAASGISSSGFTIDAGQLVVAHTYTLNYFVIQ